MVRVILWVCVIWMVPLMYFLLRNEATFKKNLAVGVTLPYEGRNDPEVQALLARFKRELGWACLAVLALAVVLMVLPMSFGLMMTLWLVWIDVCIVVPMVPYVRCNRALKAVKRARGWGACRRETAVADLSAAAQPEKRLSPLQFLLPLAVSAIPMVWALARGEGLVGLILLTGPACVLLFWVLYRWAYRRKAEVVDEDETLTAALTRVRRRAWRRCWLWGAWFMALFNVAMLITFDRPLLGLALTLVLTAALVAAMVVLEFRLRRLQERLTARSGEGFYVDEDDKWIWGMFYYAPNDRHLLVNDRVGMNVTFNLARRGGQVVMGLAAALLLLMPLIGVWIMTEERAPVTLILTDTALEAAHSGTHYDIPLDEIRSVELLEKLPPIRRVAGTAMDMVYKGKWKCDEYGALTVCLDPRTGPWLLLETEERNYLLGDGGGRAGETYGALTARLSGKTVP